MKDAGNFMGFFTIGGDGDVGVAASPEGVATGLRQTMALPRDLSAARISFAANFGLRLAACVETIQPRLPWHTRLMPSAKPKPGRSRYDVFAYELRSSRQMHDDIRRRLVEIGAY